MVKKFVTITTVFCFLATSWSCSFKQDVILTPDEIAPRKSVFNVLGVLLKSGEEIEFQKPALGRLVGNEIVGASGKPERAVYPKASRAHAFQIPVGQVVTTDDQREVVIARILEEDKTKIVFEQIPLIRIPLADIAKIHFQKKNELASGIASVFVGGIVTLGLLVIIIAATKESCPFIYSHDGSRYIFDAEPYGGATCPGLQRTEWVKLEHLKEIDGCYRLRLTNEVDETQYTDELKLVVVDHEPGTIVAPDEEGNWHTFNQPQFPMRAVDGRDRDILRYVAKTDWISWQTQEDDIAYFSGPTTKEELLFEFAKPAGADSVKILFNGCNTLWGSQMVKRFLELHGKNVSTYYAALNEKGLAHELLESWNLNEELYRLQIRVETKNGWESRGSFVGGGPFISEDKAYVIDLSGVEGDILRIRLTPPAMFWAINSIAVDYAGDLPVEAQDLAADGAVDAKGTDIRSLLGKTDQAYYAMPEIGDRAELVFKAPPQRPGRQRTIMAKVSGYYDIHLDTQGETRLDVLGRIMSEPGFGGRYGLDEYLKWTKEFETQKPDR